MPFPTDAKLTKQLSLWASRVEAIKKAMPKRVSPTSRGVHPPDVEAIIAICQGASRLWRACLAVETQCQSIIKSCGTPKDLPGDGEAGDKP